MENLERDGYHFSFNKIKDALKEIEKLGGTVVSAIGGTVPKGFGLTLLATLFDGVDKSATISDIISKFKSPCHSCGKFH